MAHPMAGQAKASQKARLGRLGATAGKSYGSSNMYKKTSYPKKRAGSSTPMTISGGSAKHRPDRMAFGGGVGGKGKKRKPAATTNIIISHAGGRGGGGGGATPPPGGGPVPVPVPRPVPVPVGAGAGGPPPMGPPPMGLPRPPIAAGGPPPGLPPGGPPPGMPPMRPPGMKAGGTVKKAAKGGFLKDTKGKGYKGYPYSPTSKTDSAVSAHKAGGKIGKRAEGGMVDELPESGYKRGGSVSSAEGVAVEGRAHGLPGGGRSAEGVAVEGSGHGLKPSGKNLNTGTGRTYGDDDTGVPRPKVKKRQMGGGLGGMPQPMGQPMGQAGGMGLGGQGGSDRGGLLGMLPGRGPTPEQQGPPTVSGRPMIPKQALTVPQPKLASAALQQPAPGTRVGFKKGGKVHGDEPEDRKLFGKMLKEKGIKKASGGFVPKQEKSKDPGLVSSKYHQQGKGYASGGVVKPSAQAGAGSGMGRLAHSRGQWPQGSKGHH